MSRRDSDKGKDIAGQPDRLVELRQRAVVFALFQIVHAEHVLHAGIFWITSQALIQIRERMIIIVLREIVCGASSIGPDNGGIAAESLVEIGKTKLVFPPKRK